MGLLAAPVFGTTALEIANGVGLAVALALLASGNPVAGPLSAPALVLAAGWVVLAAAPGGSLLASLGRVWALSAIWSVPVLLSAAVPLPWVRIGATAAAFVAPLVAFQLGRSALDGAWMPPTGPSSHHLTLAYALLPALAGALGARRPLVAAILGACILATGSAGALAAVATTLLVFAATLAGRPASIAASALSVAATLAAFALPSLADDLRRRAILWTAGLELAADGGVPPGAWREAVAPVHRRIDPTFVFPHHAHDTTIQAAADAGPAAWVALAWGGAIGLAEAPGWALAGAAGLAVAGLTQDWIGDLEVLRAASVWAALALSASGTPEAGPAR